MNTTLLQGDCLELMNNIPDGSVDLVLTDPPYGKKADKGTNGFGSAKNRRYGGGWDRKRPSKEVFDEMLRIGMAKMEKIRIKLYRHKTQINQI